jgi:hypothetical protein
LAASIPTTEPTQIVAGDTVKWTRELPDYPSSDGWSLRYAIRGAASVDVTATSDGTGYAVAIPSSATATLGAGLYQLTGWVEKDGEVYTVVGPAAITVKPNLQTAADGALQSPAERELALIDAQIAELLASPIESYSIAGRSVAKRKLEDLNRQRGIAYAKLIRQSGGKLPSHALVFRV